MDLASYGQELAQATVEAAKWVERNSDLVRNEKEGLLKELRRAGRTFRACGKSASRRMGAGVFGPSQAGKSYLISALARGESNELIAIFDQEQRDFISEINPEGGKESTGLVTRFTLAQAPALPPGYPVQTRLLTEMDLVKILANTWYADCEHSEDSQSNMEKSLAALRSMAKDSGRGIDLDALEDLREYLLKNFKGKARIQDLERDYWEEALELGQKLDLEGRIRLYSLIWDENAEFTALLRKLLRALEKLGFAEDLFCALDALIPRDKSIIDVATLRNTGEDDGDIEVCTPAGVKTRLKRSVVTALTAELVIHMRDKPADYFNHTDLLDFPGYRSRYQLDDINKVLKKDPSMLTELFLRGKVAYLFQRYCAEKELNNMLLCIGPSNQEVQDLPGVINEWVTATHGATPEQRLDKLVSLFFILTKFDVEFEDKKGSPSLQTRWDARLHASLLDFFGKKGDWPTQWTPNQPFNNMFLLRNPNYKFDSVLTYDGDEETGIRPDREKFVEDLHAAFAGSALVARHFKDVEKSWAEAMRLNDGGISNIRESLSPMCDPAIKEKQLLENINTVREAIEQRLKAFYRTDDRDELRKEKENLSKLITKSLFKTMQDKLLGQLLHNFAVSDAEIYDLYPQALRRYRERKPLRDLGDEERVSDEEQLEDFDLLAALSLSDSEEKDTAQPSLDDEAGFYASFIESKWVEKLHQIGDDQTLLDYFDLKGKVFNNLVSELATGANRLGLRQAMAEQFRKIGAYGNTSKESTARRQAVIAARYLNNYMDQLDFNPEAKGDGSREATLFAGKTVKIFEPGKPVEGLPELPEKPADFSRVWLASWLLALESLIKNNVNFDGESNINFAENSALGEILKRIGKKMAA